MSARFRAVHGLLLAIAVLLGIAPARAERTTLTAGWSFHEGDVKGAQGETFDDRAWRKVSAPHDWSIEDGRDGKPRFDSKTPGGADLGYLPGGIGWYRRTIDLDAQAAAGTCCSPSNRRIWMRRCG